MLNARTCKNWLLDYYKSIGQTDEKLIVSKHVCACSTNHKATSEFGINKENVFGFWDFVGGRFSVWCAIGVLPLSLHFGFETMAEFLKGGHSIDTHLITEKNIGVMIG
jgi:glucose-6-phosphate isomerase